jgi:hypothetical protein
VPATYDTARDEILDRFTVDWAANSPAINGGVEPEVYYDGVGQTGKEPHDAAWVRIQIRHNAGGVTGIGGPAGARRRTTKLGLATVQVFTPLFNDDGSARGLSLNEELAKVAKDAFEAQTTTSGVIFRNVRINEVGPGGPWYQSNVLAEFEYDEFV